MAPGIDLTGVTRKSRRDRHSYRKTGFGWFRLSDGKAAPPPKVKVFIICS